MARRRQLAPESAWGWATHIWCLHRPSSRKLLFPITRGFWTFPWIAGNWSSKSHSGRPHLELLGSRLWPPEQLHTEGWGSPLRQKQTLLLVGLTLLHPGTLFHWTWPWAAHSHSCQMTALSSTASDCLLSSQIFLLDLQLLATLHH